MAHYKADWFLKGATRLAQGKRFILDSRLLPQFLCYCIKSEFIGPAFRVRVANFGSKAVIQP